MVENLSQKTQNTAGSNQFLSGRFQKVSIGITIDPKIGSKEDAAVLSTGGRTSTCQATQKSTRTLFTETSERNRSEVMEQKAAWFSPKSARLETPAAETVQLYVNRASVVHSESGFHRTDTVAYGKNIQKGGDAERVEEVTYSSVQKTPFVDKRVDREEPNSSEHLRLKLQEILGTTPSQNRNNLNSPDPEENKKDINIDRNWENPKGEVPTSNVTKPIPREKRCSQNTVQSRGKQSGKTVKTKSKTLNFEENKENININRSKKNQKGKVPKHKQDSDTIENDSGSANLVLRKPITRSSTRKKAPSRNTANRPQVNAEHVKKPLSSSSSEFKLKVDENIFAFNEGEKIAGTSNRTASGTSSRPRTKTSEQKKAPIEPLKIYFDRSASDKNFYGNDREKTVLSPDKNLSCMKKTVSPSVPSRTKKQLFQSNCSEKDVQKHFSSPVSSCNAETFQKTVSPLLKRKKFSWDTDVSPAMPENEVLLKKDASSSMLREHDQFSYNQSPTFAMGMQPTPTTLSHSGVLNKTEVSKFAQKGHGSNDLDNSSPGSYQSDTNTEYTDATLDIHRTQGMESPHTKDEVKEKKLSQSSNEEQDMESEPGDYCKRDSAGLHEWFSNGNSPKKSTFSSHLTRRASILKQPERSKPSPVSPLCTNGTKGTTDSLDASEQVPDDSLARSIAQVAMVLQRFKATMKKNMHKRSSEVLSAAAEEIRLQLQNAESQILADVGTIASSSKAKRKRLESEFQEQQERLRIIHDKFKEEINQHLTDCRKTLEKLEAGHVELKGTADRQKASHRKLLKQVEEAMEVQIGEAEMRIAAIHKEAGKRMNGLKRILREFL